MEKREKENVDFIFDTNKSRSQCEVFEQFETTNPILNGTFEFDLLKYFESKK